MSHQKKRPITKSDFFFSSFLSYIFASIFPSANVYFPQQNWLLIYFCLPLNNVPKDKALFSARIGGADTSCTGTKRPALFLVRAFLSIVPFSVKLYFPELFSAAFFFFHVY